VCSNRIPDSKYSETCIFSALANGGFLFGASRVALYRPYSRIIGDVVLENRLPIIIVTNIVMANNLLLCLYVYTIPAVANPFEASGEDGIFFPTVNLKVVLLIPALGVPNGSSKTATQNAFPKVHSAARL
jgi:hypothetical protein